MHVNQIQPSESYLDPESNRSLKKIMRQSGNLNIDWMFDELQELFIFLGMMMEL